MFFGQHPKASHNFPQYVTPNALLVISSHWVSVGLENLPRFYCCHSTHLPSPTPPLDYIQIHAQKITTTQLWPVCLPSKPPPWAARAQGFPRVSGWGLDNPSLVRPVIRESSVNVVSIQTARKTGNWRKAEATGESRCTKYLDPITCINIIHPAVSLFAK